MNIGNIGSFLRSSRKARGLTQGQVADALGVSAQAVSKWERGENLPDVTLLPDLSKSLNTSVEGILNAGQEPPNAFDNMLARMQAQVDGMIDGVFEDDSYKYALDELMPYTNTIQRRAVVQKVLARGDYDALEQLIGYINGELKTELLERLLEDGQYEAIESIIPNFARKHRELIVEHFEAVQINIEIAENFMPFFDKNQIERMRRIYNE